MRLAVLVVTISVLAAGCAQPGAAGDEIVPPPPSGFEPPQVRAWTWIKAPDLPQAVSGAACAAHDDGLWVLGGLAATGSATNTVQQFVPAAGEHGTWRSAVPLPQVMHQAVAFETQGQLRVAGGYQDPFRSNALDDVYQRGPGGFWLQDQMPPLPAPRAEAMVLETEDGPAIVGGTEDGVVAARSILRPSSGFLPSWEEIGRLATPRASAAVALLNETTVLAAGGWSLARDGANGDTEVQRLDGEKATSWPAIPVPRSGFASVVFQDRLWLVGGIDATSNATDLVEFLDLDRGFWARATPLPASVRGACAVVLEDGLHVVGGRDPDGDVTAAHWVLREVE